MHSFHKPTMSIRSTHGIGCIRDHNVYPATAFLITCDGVLDRLVSGYMLPDEIARDIVDLVVRSIWEAVIDAKVQCVYGSLDIRKNVVLPEEYVSESALEMAMDYSDAPDRFEIYLSAALGVLSDIGHVRILIDNISETTSARQCHTYWYNTDFMARFV